MQGLGVLGKMHGILGTGTAFWQGYTDIVADLVVDFVAKALA